jgi:hypothetical protein
MASVAAAGKRNDGAASHKQDSPEDSEGIGWLRNVDRGGTTQPDPEGSRQQNPVSGAAAPMGLPGSGPLVPGTEYARQYPVKASMFLAAVPGPGPALCLLSPGTVCAHPCTFPSDIAGRLEVAVHGQPTKGQIVTAMTGTTFRYREHGEHLASRNPGRHCRAGWTADERRTRRRYPHRGTGGAFR